MTNPVPSDYLSRKTSRTSSNKKDTGVNVSVSKNGNTVGIKLICDSENEELRKYFSKTVKFYNPRNCIPMMIFH